jgi:glycerate kinase
MKPGLSVLVIPDKFKGSLTAKTAARAIARGWRVSRPEDALTLLPASDGGDGFGEVLSELLCAEPRNVRTVDAAHRSCRVRWWWAPKTKTAIIESARVIGLALLPPGRFHPFELDTRGLGAVVRAAVDEGARRCVIGIGGSATNDGGFGLACALGWQFLDRSGQELDRWTKLTALAQIRRAEKRRWFEELVVAVDVQNPLLGARGATQVYGPQKGLRPTDFPQAEACLRRLARVAEEQFGREFASEPGAGAAGGLGFGLRAFLGAQLQPGFAWFARHAQLNRQLGKTDLVITGEGSIDDSTFMGKGVGHIVQQCHSRGIPCIGFAGKVDASSRHLRLFQIVRGLTELTDRAQAQKDAAFWLQRLSGQVSKAFRHDAA